jgi:RND family efflux transporter MFP subunit
MSKSSLFFMAGLTSVLALALSACGASEAPVINQPRTVLVAPADLPENASAIAIGIVRGDNQAVVAAVHGGRVLTLHADVGDRVTRGQVLARLDAQTAQLRSRQAEAEARQAAVTAEERDRNAVRAAALHADAAASDADLEAARSEARAAAAASEGTRAAAAAARRDAAESVLRAPVSGIVAARQASLGGVLASGEVAFAIEGAGERRIDAVLPCELASNLKPGDRLAFRHASGRGEARLIGISARSQSGSNGRMAVFTVLSGAPAPGMVVELATRTEPVASLSVPLAAVLKGRGGAQSVLVVGPDKRLRQTPVTLHAIAGSHALVAGKLAAGDLVVAAGAEFLEAGLSVRPLRAQR